jgi:hypothetical protein
MGSSVTRGCALAIFVAKAITGCQSSEQGDGAGNQNQSDASADATIATDANVLSDAALESGAPSIILGPPVQLLNPGDLGLDSVPDVQLSEIRQPDGSFAFWIGGSVDKMAGSVAMLSTSDFATFAPVVGEDGAATPVFTASAPKPCGDGSPGSNAFDAQYAASGTVLTAADGHDLLMIYHAENHTFGNDCYAVVPFYATLGLARSTDGGRSWTRQGAIITGRDPQPTTTPTSAGMGAAVPSAISAGGYTYVFYSDYPVPGSGHSGSNSIMVARAPAAADGAPGSWSKWNAGAFGSSGMGGDSAPILPITDSACVFPRQPGITFNTYLNTYVLTMICGSGWFFSTSSDLSTEVWSTPTQFFSAPFDNQTLEAGNEYDWHLALVSTDQPSGQTTSKTGYVLWARGGYPNTPIHMLWRRSFTFQ